MRREVGVCGRSRDVFAVLVLALFPGFVVAGPAQEEAPTVDPGVAIVTQLPASEAGEFLGVWTLELEVLDQLTQGTLTLLENEEGMVGGTLVMPFRPMGVGLQDVSREGDVLQLAWDVEVGPERTRLQMRFELLDGELSGTFGDREGFVTTPIVGWQGERPASAETAETTDTEETDEQASQARSAAPTNVTEELETAAGKITIHYTAPRPEGGDLGRLEALGEGEVVRFETVRAIKLTTEALLRFGETRIEKGNVSEGYPGVYSLWLQRSADGWQLLFNGEADIWGTQRQAETDVATAPLEHSESDAEEGLRLELVEAADGGELRIAWGRHRWSATFLAE